jgi:hypothetical protein
MAVATDNWPEEVPILSARDVCGEEYREGRDCGCLL